MFTFLNFVFIAIAVGNLYVVLGNPAMGIGAVTRQMAGAEGGSLQLGATLIVSAAVQAYLIALVFPLRALQPELGMAWAALMTLSTCESIYTGQKMWDAVQAGDKDAAFPFHDSWVYRAWQVSFNLCMIAACVYLILPKS